MASVSQVSSLTSRQIEIWLAEIVQLPQYIARFQGCLNGAVIPHLTEEKLAKLGVTNPAHALRIAAEAAELLKAGSRKLSQLFVLCQATPTIVPRTKKPSAMKSEHLIRLVSKIRKASLWRVKRSIAAGCNGQVFQVVGPKAETELKGMSFALKVVFNFGLDKTSDIESTYKKEYDVLITLDRNPRINGILNYFTDVVPPSMLPFLPEYPRQMASEAVDGHRRKFVFIVLPYLPQTLKQCVPVTSLEKQKRMVLQLLEGALFLTKNRVVHRDFKLDNVLVSENGSLQIADFGESIAFAVGAPMKLPFTPGMSVGGNQAHLAPEVLSAFFSRKTVDYTKQASWAIGVLAVELSGSPHPLGDYPVSQQRPGGLVDYDLTQISLPSTFPPQYAECIHSMLHPDPARRPSVRVALRMLTNASIAVAKEDGPDIVFNGSVLWKIPFSSSALPEKRLFRVTQHATGKLLLEWIDQRHPKKRPRSIDMGAVDSIRRGWASESFKRQLKKRGESGLPPEDCCFSIAVSAPKPRTVDLAAMSAGQCAAWMEGLQSIVFTEEEEESEEERPVAAESIFDLVKRGDLLAFDAAFSCPVETVNPATGDTLLLAACRYGQARIAKSCLAAGANFDPHPSFGGTALHLAAKNGHLDCVKLLLETAKKKRSSIANVVDSNKETALMLCCKIGNNAILEVLVHHGAYVECLDSKGQTPLHLAALYGQDKTVEKLVSLGADFSIQDGSGATPLHLAVVSGSLPTVIALLSFGASPLALDAQGSSPYDLSAHAPAIRRHMADLFGFDDAEPQSQEERLVQMAFEAPPVVGTVLESEEWELRCTEEGYEFWYNATTGESKWKEPAAVQEEIPPSSEDGWV